MIMIILMMDGWMNDNDDDNDRWIDDNADDDEWMDER